MPSNLLNDEMWLQTFEQPRQAVLERVTMRIARPVCQLVDFGVRVIDPGSAVDSGR
jgi:hypothetical protein